MGERERRRRRKSACYEAKYAACKTSSRSQEQILNIETDIAIY